MQSPQKGQGPNSNGKMAPVDRSKVVGTPIEVIQGKYQTFKK